MICVYMINKTFIYRIINLLCNQGYCAYITFIYEMYNVQLRIKGWDFNWQISDIWSNILPYYYCP